VSQSRLHPDEDDAPECRGREPRPPERRVRYRYRRRHRARHRRHRRAERRHRREHPQGAYENVESNENIDFVEGHGIFESPHEIRVDDRTLSAETIVINTGARPTRPSIDGLDDVDVHDSTDLLERASIPHSLAVIGGGYVGCEYAQMYSRFGADVTVFQRGDTLLPDEDPDVSEVIETAFENEEITVQTGTPVTALTETNDGIRVDAGADGTVSVTASDVALAAGRTPNTDGLQLEDIGASLDENGFVETDDSFRTTADGVYAIGDVSGPPMFTHSARDDADLLYRHLAKSEEISTKGRTVPWAVFTDPQIGHVGLTEQEAREAGTRSASAARTSLTKASRRRSAKRRDLSN